MTDFLLVHDVGSGSWCWGRVWGHLTAPVGHPPKLYARGRIGNVIAIDLPGHGARASEDVSGLTFDDFVSALSREVQSHSLRNLIMVGHGVTAPIVLRAAAQLQEPPRRIVLLGGVIPDEGRSSLDMLPLFNRKGFKVMASINAMMRKEFRLPKAFVTNVWSNGMDPFDMIQIVGRFGPLPLSLVRTRVYLNDVARSCPITYIPLWRDRLLPLRLQMRMAERLGGVEIARELDSCHEVMIERPKQVADLLVSYA